MRIPLLSLCLVFLASPLAEAQTPPPPSFTLRFDAAPGDPLANLGPFKSPFFLVVKDGEAFLAKTDAPQKDQDKRKGTLDIIVRNGIDPATRTFKDPILQVVFHYDSSGWTDDRVLTDITVPLALPKKGATPPLMVFSSTASLTSLWMTFHQGSIRYLTDPMNVRTAQTLKCTTISSDLKAQ